MKTTLFLKQADLFLQLIAVLIGLTRLDIIKFVLLMYFVVGGIQVASSIINRLALPAMYICKGRIVYEIILCIIVIIVVACYLFPHTFVNDDLITFLLFTLLFAAPVMAICYLVITYIELNTISKFVHRKDYV